MLSHSLLILSDDPFGAAVAGWVRSSALAPDGANALRDPTAWPPARVRALVRSRRDRAAEERMETLSWGTGRAWVPVQIEARSIRVGPVVVPGRSACLECFYRRQRQHGRRSALDDELEHALTGSGSPGYQGQLAAHVGLVAGLLRAIAESDDAVDAFASRFWRLGYADVSVREALVTPVAGCRRCDPDLDEGERYRRLVQHFP